MSEQLARLAELYGIEPGYRGAFGDWLDTSDDTRTRLLSAMGVDADTAAGVEAALAAVPDDISAHQPFDVIARAHRPEWLEGTRAWGLACQLYGLRSGRNWGMGDFEDLARLAELAAGQGADFIGVNPLHALFPADPHRYGPYAPSSRRFLNVLYIAPDQVPEYAVFAGHLDEVEDALKTLREADLVDYPAVCDAKMAAFEVLFDAFRALPETHARKRSFAGFRARHGGALEAHCLYDALAEHFAQCDVPVAWTQWPDAYRDRASDKVAAFAKTHAVRIDFHAWLQWVAAGQLEAAQARALAAGMRVGLYLDIAVGVAPDGAATWIAPHTAIAGAEIGAPPDAFSKNGQQWGLAPLSPFTLQRTDLAALRDMVDATMAHAGAVRIDHAMGLQRLFWIPAGGTAAEGAYVRYPMRDMFAAVGEASARDRCLVIGEDLGVVPEGFREVMRDSGLFAYRVLFFERDDTGRFKGPGEHDADALVCVATHDTPTLKGWWQGLDIDWRARLDLITGEEAEQLHAARVLECERLLEAMGHEGLRPEGAEAQSDMTGDLVVAVHRFIARTPCRLLTVQLDDTLGIAEQANMPGTVDTHPNWRRKLPVTLEELARHDLLARVLAAVAEERPK